MSPAVVRVIQGALGDGVVVAAAACRLPRAVATSVLRIGGARIVSVERAAARADSGVSGLFRFPSGSRGVYRFVSFSSVRMRRTVVCVPVAVLQILVFLMLIVSGDSPRRGYPRASGRLGTYCVAGCE